jgi:purine catabolism regulator
MSSPLALADLLELEPFRRCRPEILCGHHLVDRPVRWVHTSELAEAAALLKGEELLLTSGRGLVGRGVPGLRAYIQALGDRRAALGLELGWTFSSVPAEMLQAAREYDVPVIALHEVVPFVELAEAGQEAILTRRLSTRPPTPNDQGSRRARLLQELEANQVGAASLSQRLGEVGIGHRGVSYCGIVVRGFRQGFGGLLAEALSSRGRRQPVLSAIASGDLVALIPDESGPQLGPTLLSFIDDFSRSRGEATTCRIAVAEPGPILAAAPRLTHARHALSLAASLGIQDRVLAAPLVSARMVLNRLSADALAGKLVQEELGPLIEHDHRNDTRLVETLQTYLLHGSNIQLTAEIMHCSRQSLYRRKEQITRLIGDFDVPERHANLIVALELHALRGRFAGLTAPQ